MTALAQQVYDLLPDYMRSVADRDFFVGEIIAYLQNQADLPGSAVQQTEASVLAQQFTDEFMPF